MESMDTPPPLGTFMLLVALEPSGAGALNRGLAEEEEEEEEEQGGEDCAGGLDEESGRL